MKKDGLPTYDHGAFPCGRAGAPGGLAELLLWPPASVSVQDAGRFLDPFPFEEMGVRKVRPCPDVTRHYHQQSPSRAAVAAGEASSSGEGG